MYLFIIEWCTENSDYTVLDDNTVKLSDAGCGGVIYSRTPSYICGHSVSFRVGDFADSKPDLDDGIGLTSTDSGEIGNLLRSKGFIFYSFQGIIPRHNLNLLLLFGNISCGSKQNSVPFVPVGIGDVHLHCAIAANRVDV